MSTWIVELVDPGCDCCSFVPVAEFDTEEEAKKFVDGSSDYWITELEDDEDDDE